MRPVELQEKEYFQKIIIKKKIDFFQIFPDFLVGFGWTGVLVELLIPNI